MSQKSEVLISDALQMPEEERAMIAERLIASIDHEFERDTELAWQKELQTRIDDIDTGKVTCIPWEQVRARLRENAHAHA